MLVYGKCECFAQNLCVVAMGSAVLFILRSRLSYILQGLE